jgi:hypothetical protein
LTAAPEISFQSGKVILSSATKGASIGYRKSTSDTWSVYKQPFEWIVGDSLYVNAHRIGYEASEVALVLK